MTLQPADPLTIVIAGWIDLDRLCRGGGGRVRADPLILYAVSVELGRRARRAAQ